MEAQRDYWDGKFRGGRAAPRYDGWLDRHLDRLRGAGTVVDLGCGSGADTVALSKAGIETVACDFSQAALDRLLAALPGARTLRFDMREGLPFADGSVGAVLSDLSLHYFDAETTRRVIGEVWRALRPDGALLCRVNARSGYAPAAGDRQIEDGYHFAGGTPRRYFDPADVRAFFGAFELIDVREAVTGKYGYEKPVIEFEAVKPAPARE